MNYDAILSKRTDLDMFGSNKTILYALELYFDIDDILHVASESIVDKSNDKKCDLIYIDKEKGIIVIGQSYLSQDLLKKEAKADKAADLNTAISWLLKKDRTDIPINLKNQSDKIHESIENGDIHTLELWYCHNLTESENVRRELQRVVETASSLLKDNYPDNSIESVYAKEYGKINIQKLFEDANNYIVIKDEFELNKCSGFYIKDVNYESFVTTISGSWIKEQYGKYKSDLFSSNIRNYLGSIRSSKNVNHNIKISAKNNYNEFFTYNNGITAVVENLNYNIKDNIFSFNGLAIVNGAQTTGAISNSESKNLNELKVLIRFIKCSSEELIKQIVKFNNTQNEINISDFRSGDSTQKRLCDEFKQENMFDYYGARRGGETDKIKRSFRLIPSDNAAQALAAFHMEPEIAYNDKRQLWSNDKLYHKLFNDNTTSKHIVFCFSLLRTIENIKSTISEKNEIDRKQDEKNILDVLRKRGSTYLFMASISRVFETILDKPIPNKFTLSFKENIDLDLAMNNWDEILNIALPFIGALNPAVDVSLKNTRTNEDSINNFNAQFTSISQYHRTTFNKFSKLLL